MILRAYIVAIVLGLCALVALAVNSSSAVLPPGPEADATVRESSAAASPDSIVLNDRCPPSFEMTQDGACELRNLYQLYDSLQNRGVGGTKTALPAHRDGFSPEQIDLGRYLFFDPVLSGDGSTSCASCHHPDLGFSDGRPRAVGVAGHPVQRSSPTLWNVAFLKHLFWDARADSLEEQVQGPLYSPEEMGNTPGQLLSIVFDPL